MLPREKPADATPALQKLSGGNIHRIRRGNHGALLRIEHFGVTNSRYYPWFLELSLRGGCGSKDDTKSTMRFDGRRALADNPLVVNR
jgi:hypothetical protein